MGKGSSIRSLAVAELQVMDLKRDMRNYAVYVDEYRRALCDMWTGNGTNSYWNGENAYAWFESASNEFNNLCSNYNNNYAAFKSFAKTYVKAWNKAKKSKKSVDAYINGVPTEKNNLISGVPSTVNKDAVSDEESDIEGASRAFAALNSSLTNMISILSGMMDGWNNVRTNTKGDIQSRAIRRYDYTLNHKKRLSNAQSNFITNYTMDNIFSDEDAGI